MQFLKTVQFALLALLALVPLARADNSVPIASRQIGDATFILFAHNLPLRVGPVRLEACLIRTKDGEPMPTAQFQGILIPEDVETLNDTPAPVWCGNIQYTSDSYRLDFAPPSSGNQLLQSATVIVADAGKWRLDIQITSSPQDSTSVEIPIEIDEPLPPLLSQWPWLMPVPILLGLFVFSRKTERSRSHR